MYHPRLIVTPAYQETVDEWHGYNHNLRIADSEFYEMTNMSSDQFPVLSPRAPRGRYAAAGDYQGLVSKDALCYVDGPDFVINGYRVDMKLSTDPEDNPKQLISMGAFVIIMPDRMYINTADLTDFGKIEAEVKTAANVTFTLTKKDGSAYEVTYTQDTEPENPADKALWINTSTTPHTLNEYAKSTSSWVGIATVYVKVSCPGIGAPFEVGDGITLSGLKDAELVDGDGAPIPAPEQLQAMDGAHVIIDKGDDFIVIIGIIDKVTTVSNQLTVSRKMPLMDFVIESKNRLWGCRYGPDAGGKVVNMLYASKLGDFKNWTVYQGAANDSYFMELGSDGPFTGAITYQGNPHFFKEHTLHMVYGDTPATFGRQDTQLRGVQQGCSRSLSICNEILYYKSRGAVMSFNGSLPEEVSGVMGAIPYSDAVAAAHNNKYYISMMGPDGEWNLFVLDTIRGLWHREDDFHARDLCSNRNELYGIDADTGEIIAMLGSGEEYEDVVPWLAQTGDILLHDHNAKYVSRINIRLSMPVDSILEVAVRYDDQKEWQPVYSERGCRLDTHTIPIRPQRFDHMQICFKGYGPCKIYSLIKTLRQGSDRF